MAGKDGYELIRSLRANGFGSDVLPAIALTAFARPQDRADALAAGFQDHRIKPIDAPTLISRIGSLRIKPGALGVRGRSA
jgi:CheY-like chemotaxis protein